MSSISAGRCTNSNRQAVSVGIATSTDTPERAGLADTARSLCQGSVGELSVVLLALNSSLLQLDAAKDDLSSFLYALSSIALLSHHPHCREIGHASVDLARLFQAPLQPAGNGQEARCLDALCPVYISREAELLVSDKSAAGKAKRGLREALLQHFAVHVSWQGNRRGCWAACMW